MSASESGAWRPLNLEYAVHRNRTHVGHFIGITGIVDGMDRKGGRHGQNHLWGEVKLDNPTQNVASYLNHDFKEKR